MVEHELEEGCGLGEEEVDVLHMLLEVGMCLSEAELSHRKVLVEVEEAEVVEEVVEVEVFHK